MNYNEILSKANFDKLNGLITCIVQDSKTNKVLMQAYMNRESLEQTIEYGKLCFYSRSRNKLWTKGEESGNFLQLDNLLLDCDQDSILAKATPVGPACHTGSDTCWGEQNKASSVLFLNQLEQVIQERKSNSSEKSYTASLFKKGINKIAQKVGEEAVELVIESKDDNRDLFLGEAADLLFHYQVLLAAKGFQLSDVIEVLKKRHR